MNFCDGFSKEGDINLAHQVMGSRLGSWGMWTNGEKTDQYRSSRNIKVVITCASSNLVFSKTLGT